MPNCLICDAGNAKQHYGSWCCNGCKGFFWRSISSKRRYICLSRGQDRECELQDGRRNSCRACRLKKCLDVGMDPNLIRDCWGKTSSSPDTTATNRDDVGHRCRLGSTGQNENAQPSMAAVIKCENVSEPELLRSVPHISPCNIQLLSDYLVWVQCLPELVWLSEQDKNVLMLNRSRACGWLVMAHRQFDCCAPSPKWEDDKQAEVLRAEIVGPLSEMDVSMRELELLRRICFFSTVPQLSAEGKQLVAQVQNAYVRTLSELALKRFVESQLALPNFGATPTMGAHLFQSVFRLNRLMHVLTAVEKIAHQHD